jgi:tetratricopeptide (TPR) repeat protein
MLVGIACLLPTQHHLCGLTLSLNYAHCYRREVTMSSDHLEVLMKQAEELMQAKRYEEAIYYIKKSLKISPNSVDVLRAFGKLLLDLHQYERAATIFEKILQLEPGYTRILHPYKTVLIKLGRGDQTSEIFDQALKSAINHGLANPYVLLNYISLFMSTGDYFKAGKIFEYALDKHPNNFKLMLAYVNFLIKEDQIEEAIQEVEKLSNTEHAEKKKVCQLISQLESHKNLHHFFEKLLEKKPSDLVVVRAYIKSLINSKQYTKAFNILFSVFNADHKYFKLLDMYTQKMREHNQYFLMLRLCDKIRVKPEPKSNIILYHFCKSLSKKPTYTQNAIQIINSFFNLPWQEETKSMILSYLQGDLKPLLIKIEALVQGNDLDVALKIYKFMSEAEPSRLKPLVRYADALAATGQYEKAFQYLEQSLQLQPDDPITLNRYASALAATGQYEKAFQYLEQSLQLQPDNSYTLGQYGILLGKFNRHEEACSIFAQCSQIKLGSYTLFQYSRSLEEVGNYEKSIQQLMNINLEKLPTYQANVIRLSLGRLYYRIKQSEKGDEYFEAAIKNSDDKERTLLYSARSILASNPYNETAVEMLQQIAEDSPRYAQALEMLALNLNEEDYFEMVNTDTQSGLSDTEMLNRAMYHKIANEISILKGIAYRILRRSEQQDPLLNGIIQDIEDVFSEVDRRRAAQKSEIETISHDDYGSILAVISKTAHDISDFVNNQLAVIESKTRRAMQKLQPADTHYAQFKKLLTQLELTQAALNDLKAINEGIRIKYRRFKVSKLFEKWVSESQIDQAQILLDIQNGNSEFNGDEEKIKSALNELVENSLKHNSTYQNLTIRITSQDVMNPSGIWGRNIPGEKTYLFIEFTDNGKGVPADKKDWIFQPLKTTSQEDKGSGLGLFIIRKTLTKMNGYIRETGNNGARFEIYIPYNTVKA